MIDMELAKLKEEQKELDYGADPKDLPIMTAYDVNKLAQSRVLCIIHGLVHDVTEWAPKHPGGSKMLIKYSEMSSKNMKDVGNLFDGEIYNHTNAARNMMSHMRVGKTEEFESQFLKNVGYQGKKV